MPNPRLFPASTGTHNECDVIASGQIIGRIAFLGDHSKPWFWVISLPFRGSRRHPRHGFEATREARRWRSLTEAGTRTGGSCPCHIRHRINRNDRGAIRGFHRRHTAHQS
jgi:hypothetical protein